MKLLSLCLISATLVLGGCADSGSDDTTQSGNNGLGMSPSPTPTSSLAAFANAEPMSDSLPIDDVEALRADMQARFGDDTAEPTRTGNSATLTDLIQ